MSGLADSARHAARRAALLVGESWPAYSRLLVVGEQAGWVIDEELRAVAGLAEKLGIRVARRWPPSAVRRQSVFYGSHFTFFDRAGADDGGNRFATTYFHGLPGTAGAPEFDRAFDALRRQHQQLDRVQVSHREVEELVLSSGIDAAKVFRIPIAVEPRLFPQQTAESRAAARERLGIAATAFVVGSFQKDGVGWGDGLEPKLVKGPDVLVETLAQLHARRPDLHVLLSAPARGYVTKGLTERGVPHTHRVLDRYDEVGGLYAALDAYVVTSRQEGGPKGVLESMSSGVPLVSTRVGQAVDLVRDGENGWLVDVDDVSALVVRLASPDLGRVVARGVETAAANSYEAQLPLWRAFFDGFVRT